jgi:hypothetical protein
MVHWKLHFTGNDYFIKINGSEKITPYDSAGIFNNAYSQVVRTVEAVSGFKATLGAQFRLCSREYIAV